MPSGRRRHRSFRRAASAFFLLSLASARARGQVVIKVSGTVSFRLGMFLQGWADLVQDPISEGYSQILYLRRIRFLVAGTVAKDVSFFFQTDNPRLIKDTNHVGVQLQVLYF